MQLSSDKVKATPVGAGELAAKATPPAVPNKTETVPVDDVDEMIFQPSFEPIAPGTFPVHLSSPFPAQASGIPPVKKPPTAALPKVKIPTHLIKKPTEKKSGDEKEFASIEHIKIGLEAFKLFQAKLRKDHNKESSLLFEQLEEQKLFDSGTYKLTIVKESKESKEPGLMLNMGQLVALGGDFFGPPPGKPISFGETEEEQDRRFKLAFNELIECKRDKLEKLLAEIRKSTQYIQEAQKKGQKPSIHLTAHDNQSDKAFIKLTTLSKYLFFPFSALHNRYLQLATDNFDHFGKDAITAYQAAHRVAIATAKEAREKQDLSLFVLALAYELFGCHYLTDAFSAGHMRTPRRELVDHVKKTSYRVTPGKIEMAGLCAKAEHDEDNENGLAVNSEAHPEPWQAYGDECILNPGNETHRERVYEAVSAGLFDIYDVFHGRPEAVSALKHLPKVVPDIKQNPNYPLFKTDEKTGAVLARKEVNNPKCSDYVSDWTPAVVLLKRKCHWKKADGTSSDISAEEQEKLKAELEILEKCEGKVGYEISKKSKEVAPENPQESKEKEAHEPQEEFKHKVSPAMP